MVNNMGNQGRYVKVSETDAMYFKKIIPAGTIVGKQGKGNIVSVNDREVYDFTRRKDGK